MYYRNLLAAPTRLSLQLSLVSRETQVSGNIMFTSATQPRPPPQRHNFVVSAITFEGFKLRYSNLTHALLIQISRTSSIIDIVVPSKMAAGGHFVKNLKTKRNLYQSEMARNAIESEFRTSKMPGGGHFVKNFPKLKSSVLI